MKSLLIGGLALPMLMALSCAEEKPKPPQRKVGVEEGLVVEGELKVISALPKGKVESVEETREIVVTFSEPMIPLKEVPREELPFPLEIVPSIEGSYEWRGTRTLAFIPDPRFPLATEFEVLIPKGVKSFAGRELREEYSWVFETARPNLQQSYPRHNSKWYPLDQKVYLYFNIPMSPGRARPHISLSREGGQAIGFRIRHMKEEEKEIDWRLRRWQLERTLVLEPSQRYEREAWCLVELSPQLPAAEGNLDLGKERRVRFFPQHVFRFDRILQSQSHPPEEPLRFKFSNPVVCADLMGKISITPRVKGLERYRESTWSDLLLRISVELLPDTFYAVKISKDLRDRFGNVLGTDHEVAVHTISYHPYLNMPTGTGIVESYGQLKYPVTMVNLDSLRLQLALVPEDQIIAVLKTPNLFSTCQPYQKEQFYAVDRMWKTSLVRNRRTVLPLALTEVLSTKSPYGFLFIQLDGLRPCRHRASKYCCCRHFKALAEVTDLGFTGKFSSENGLLWVTSLKDATPKEDALVRLRDEHNKLLWEGRTDENGLVEIPGWEELGVGRPSRWEVPLIYSFAQQGEDQALISSRWGTGIYPYRFGIDYNWRLEPRNYEAYIYTEKGLYRAGQDVHFKAMVREKKRGRWRYPRVRDFRVEIKNSRDEKVLEDDLRLSSSGSCSYDLSLPEDAPTGVYKIKLAAQVDGDSISFQKTFRVEAYRPAEFEVKVRSKKEEFTFGDEFVGTIKGWYLFGSPMSGEDVEWDLILSPFWHTPPGWEGFRFGPGWFEDSDERRRIGSGKGKLDRNGETEVTVRLDGRGIKGSMRLVCEGTVTAKTERSVSGRKDFVVHRGEHYIGLKPLDTFLLVGDTLGVEIIAVEPSGMICPKKRLNFKVIRREWHSVRKAETGGRYHWVSTEKDTTVLEKTVKSDVKPILEQFIPEKPGRYLIRCEGKDSRGNPILTSLSLWVAGDGYVGWMRRDDDLIELVKDRTVYSPGDNARILVKSPYEEAIALVTVEREFVIDEFLTHVKGSADIVSVPIKDDYLPNVFVSVVLLQGRKGHNLFSEEGEDIGKPSFKIGYVNLSVTPISKKLNVRVAPDKDEYRPRDTVWVDIEATDQQGEPVRGEVALACVDLGVLSLIGYKTPDPFSHFYRERPLSVCTSELRLHLIGERSYGEKGESRGGAGAMEAAFPYREKFIETVYWNPTIRTDESGRAKVKFELPDNLTTFQLMAVAATDEDFGSGDGRFRVNKPLLLSPSLPRFVRVEDDFWGGVLVHNRTPEDGKVRVEARGEGVDLLSDSQKLLKVEAGEEEEFLFHWAVKDTHQITLYFKGAMRDETDGLKLVIKVDLPKVTEAVAVYEQTEQDAEQWAVIPDSIFPGVGGLHFSLSSSALAGLERGVEYLREYPYECLEQELSKILPFILAEDIINTFNLSSLRGRALRDTVQGLLKRVKNYQDEGGGFHFWLPPCWGLPSPYLSAYAMYTLAMAKRAGYELDQDMVEKGKGYLERVLRREDWEWRWPYSLNERLTTCSFIVYSLALWEVKEEAYVHRLFEVRDQISIFGKTLLLKAIRETHLAEELTRELVEILYNKLKVEPTLAHFEEEDERDLRWIYHSNVRTTAFVLQALLSAKKEVPFAEKVVKWLNTERKADRWRNTQENVYVFDAFSTYYRVYEKVKPDFSARVLLDAKEVMEEAFRGRSLEVRKRKVPLDDLPKEKTLPIKIEHRGEGRLYYGIRLIYAKKGFYEGVDRGISVKKEIKPLEGSSRIFQRGQMYQVTLTLYTPQERLFLVLDDPIPAGFEIVNTQFQTVSQELKRRLGEIRRKERTRWWGSFDHEEIYDERYLIFATSLDEGEHSISYLMKALTSGRFLLPPTKAEEMYAPEVFGSSSQGAIEIR